jgi:thiamine biosynthesis lipoprotein
MDTYVISFRAMGCQINVWLETDGDGSAILQQVPDWIEAIETRLSRFRPDSELSRLNTRVGDWVTVSETMCHALAEARRAARITDGLVTPLVLPALLAAGYDRSFDLLSDGSSPPAPAHDTNTSHNTDSLNQWGMIQLDVRSSRVWLPGPVDLGGTAKGWAAERIADQLAEYGACLVDLGGDIVGRGSSWPVQVHDPFHAETPFNTIGLADRAIATSGTDFRRWGVNKHHIIDPRSGQPAVSDLVSATVIHPDAVLAEAFAKAVLLQGSLNGLAWLAQYPDAAGLAFDHEGRVLATENFLPYIVQGA